MGRERENVHCHLWLYRSMGGCHERTLALGSDSPVNCSWLIIDINNFSIIPNMLAAARYEGMESIGQDGGCGSYIYGDRIKVNLLEIIPLYRVSYKSVYTLFLAFLQVPTLCDTWLRIHMAWVRGCLVS